MAVVLLTVQPSCIVPAGIGEEDGMDDPQEEEEEVQAGVREGPPIWQAQFVGSSHGGKGTSDRGQ